MNPAQPIPATSGDNADLGITDRQYLNPADRLMLAAHDGLQRVGHSGFLCQTHVWLTGRIDVAALRTALHEMNHLYPVMTSRLVTAGPFRSPYWQYRPHAEVTLREHTPASSAREDVWRYAESLCAKPFDLHAADPISWHLLHLPDGRDVLILAFSHALMDGKAPEHVLKLLHELLGAAPDSNSRGRMIRPADDDIRTHLQQAPPARRLRAVLHRLKQELRMLRSAALVIPRSQRTWKMQPFRILVRELSDAQTSRATSRTKTLCGFPNLAPAVVAAVFRAIHALGPADEHRGRQFKTDVPLNLRPPGRSEPLFRNYMTFIRLAAATEDLADGDQLVQRLHAQMRDELRKGADLAALQLMTIMAPHAGLMTHHLKHMVKKGPLSLGFGFLGPVATGLDRIGTTPIGWLYTMNIALSPPGITLQAHQYAGRLNLVLTYIGAAVTDELAAALLDHIIRDLTGEQSEPPQTEPRKTEPRP